MSTYINKHNQQINPGDRVVVIAQGRGSSIRERVGVFESVSKGGFPQVRVTIEKYGYRHPCGKITRYRHPDAIFCRYSASLLLTYSAGRVYKLCD